jgi:hypothetical protein
MASLDEIRRKIQEVRKDLVFTEGETDPIEEIGNSESGSAHFWQADAFLRLAEESLSLAILCKEGGTRGKE